jgi:carboxymethylenebutenolidase
MCYTDSDRPPLLPEGAANGPATGRDLVLTADDGTRFSTFEALPAGAASAQVLIYPDIRGLHAFYKDLALRFAEVGYAALAIDYFGRTAGVSPRDDAFEWQPHVAAMTLPGVLADTRAALAHLRAGVGADRPTFLLGFCRGGSLSLYAATEDFGLAGIIPFYAGLSRAIDPARGTPVDVAPSVRTPVLGLFGGSDPGIPPEHVQALDAALDQAGVPHEIIVYPGAPHSFFDRKAADFADESRDAWQRLLAFIGATTDQAV